VLVLNFSHPLTPNHLEQVEVLTGRSITRVVEIDSQVDNNQPLTPQVVSLIDQVGISAADWQTLPYVVNPPSLNYIAMIVWVELHGRCGYFLPMIRLRLIPESLPPQYEVAEIINLQTIREQARIKRKRNH